MWKISKGKRVKAGDVAGAINDERYVQIKINNKSYKAHRLAWLYIYGVFPTEQMDHISHNRADNSIVNLREVNNIDNHKNLSKPKNNTSGTVGVYWYRKAKRWVARIRVDKETVNLGSFINFSEAVKARKDAEILYGYHENHGKWE